MEQQTDVRALLGRGETLLKENHAREAAADYARAVQLEPNDPAAHLGLAEAALALGDLGVAQAAGMHVQQLAPQSGEAAVARAILATIAGRYDAALTEVDRAVDLQPDRGYTHALRAYVLRRLGQRYEGALAEARAARTWGTRDLDHLFPAPPAVTTASATTAPGSDLAPSIPTGPAPRPWSERSPVERQMVRARFLVGNTAIVTYTLIVIDVLVYIGQRLFPVITQNGLLAGVLIEQDPLQAYRLVTSMFLHDPTNLLHIGANMLSLYFVGVIVERIFGSGKFTLIYFASGILAGVVQAVMVPSEGAIGASGAIFGIFGAFGAFILLRRRWLGPAANGIIGQWIFWLALNLFLSISVPGIALFAHLGGLISGFLIGALLTTTMRPKQRTF